MQLFIIFRLIETSCAGEKSKKKSNSRASLSLVRCPPLSRPPHHRSGAGKAFLPLSLSEPRRAPHAKPGAHTVALVRQLDNIGAQTAMLSL